MQNRTDRPRRGGGSLRWVRVGLVGAITAGLVAFIGAQPAAAYGSSQGLAANPWIMEELAAQAGTAIVSGVGLTAAGQAAVAPSSPPAWSPLGVLQNAGGLVADVGNSAMILGVGAVVGLGALPGLSGLFGTGGSTAALPSTGAAAPAGATTYAGCPNTLLVGSAGYLDGGVMRGSLDFSGCSFVGPYSGVSYVQFTLGAGVDYSRAYINAVSTVDGPYGTAGTCYTITYMPGGGSGHNWSTTTTTAGPATETFWRSNTAGGLACGGMPDSKVVGEIRYGYSPTVNNNPLRWIESTGHCKLPNGTVVAVTTSSSTFTRATGSTGAQTSPAAPAVFCPPGQLLVDGKAEVVTEGSATRVQLGATYTVNPGLATGLLGDYSDCLTTICSLHVVRLVPELDCTATAPGAGHPCRDWSTDTAIATNWGCRYGSHALSLSSCSGLKSAYGLSPSLQPNSGPGAAPAPVGVDVGADPTAGQTPGLSDGGDCVPSGLGLLNPFWVMKALACALKWAFVPKVAPSFSTINALVQARAPFSIVTGAAAGIGSFVSGMGSAGGCSALPDFTPPTLSTNHELQLPCAGPSGISGWAALYTSMQLMLWLSCGLGLWAMARADIGARDQS